MMDKDDVHLESVAVQRKPPHHRLMMLPSALDKISSRSVGQRKSSVSVRRLGTTSSPHRRPSTALSTHSRIHQALQRSESEFVFSSKEATVDGMLYSSRFEHTPARIQLPPNNIKSMKRDPQIHSTSSPKAPTAMQPGLSVHVNDPTTPSETTVALKKHPKHRPASSSYLHQRHNLDQRTPAVAARDGPTEVNATPTAAMSIVRHDDVAYIQRKRRCARTFEEMIFARIQALPNKIPHETDPSQTNNQAHEDGSADRGGLEKLLGNGIIQSIVALSTLSDQATQAHCCRSFYYLSQVHSARKPMVTHGVITSIKLLARSATAKARQDLAATLCHLCEEPHLIEALMFEGIDRCLVRLFATTHPETKRICALTVFNISSDANKIKHFVEPFAQLLFSSTKSSYGHTAASSYLMKAIYNVARLPMFHASLLGENIPRFLAAQIPHVAHNIQILALQALVSLCDVKANRLQILSQAFCKLLATMLTVANHEVQEMALLAVLLLSQDDGSRIKLCNWIPVASLLHTATTRLENPVANAGTPSLVFLDSCILRNLCDSVLTHHELLEERAMPLLLAMSRVTDHEIKSNAVCALVSIIASSPEESADFVVDMLDELITLTRSSQPRICGFAIGAVYNIACNDDCLPLLVRSSDLVDCLFELARDATQSNVADLTAAVIYRLLMQHATSGDDIMRHQESINNIPSLLLTHGFLPVLVRLLRTFPTAQSFTVQALYLLAHNDHGKVFPHGTDDIWDLVCALNHEEETTSSPSTASDLIAARSAVTLIAVLANERVNHRILVRNGMVFRFLKRLRRVTRSTTRDSSCSSDLDDETLVMNTVFVYYSLAVSQEGCEQLVREQGIEELIHLARTAKLESSEQTHRVKELFMLTMCRVSSFMGLEVKLIEHGAIDAIMVLALVSSADSVVIKALCIKTLANCLVAKVCARPLIEHGVIWALASLAGVDSSDTRAACAVSLCNLATVPFMLARFLDAGAPRALVSMLQKCHQEPTTALVVVKAIGNLVANEKICLALVNEEIEKHLSVYFASPTSSNEMRQLAAMVLLRVTSANDAVISLDHLKHGVFVWMEQIITMEDETLVKNCMLTVHDLTCSTTIDVAELDVDHILRIVVQVVERHAHSGDVLTMCLWILYNLSCQLGVLPDLVRPEILAFLHQKVPNVTLPFPLPNAPVLTTSGSTQTLLTGAIAQTTVPATQPLDAKLCAYIVHNISCARDDTRRPGVLASVVNARCVAILSDLYLQRDDLKETCAVATCNLAVGRVNTTRVVEDRAGDLVIHFVFSSLFHRCHYRLVSIALRKMVNAPGNQSVLLHRGVVRAIVRVLTLVLDSGCADVETTRNLMASLSVLAKGTSYVSRLLQDGALPIVIAVSESKGVSGTSSVMGMEILGYCFEILSELGSVDFEAFLKTERTSDDEINVINTLTRLSELHQWSNPTASTSVSCYYERGESSTHALAFAQVLTIMKKTTSSTNSVKKNLELQVTFHVPARKWVPEVMATLREPPSLECTEIPLTEGSQAMPDEIKQRIKGLPALGKEPLVRDEHMETETVSQSVSIASLSTEPEESNEVHTDTTEVVAPLTAQRTTTKKQLLRAHAGRNLSLAPSTMLLL